MEFKEIQELIRMASKSNLAEIRIEKDSFKITIRTRDYYNTSARTTEAAPVTYAIPSVQTPVVAPVQVAASAPVSGLEVSKEQSNTVRDSGVSFKSPMVGTFYRAAGPDKEPFVKVGDVVKPGTVLCVVEAMKLFNEIESDISGKVVKILVDNAKPVEYDQPLFIIEPM